MIKPSVLDCIKDHPRLCGEKNTHRTAAVGIAGSPPPMRGKDDDGSTGNPKGRITPAYAGKRENGCSGEPRN